MLIRKNNDKQQENEVKQNTSKNIESINGKQLRLSLIRNVSASNEEKKEDKKEMETMIDNKSKATTYPSYYDIYTYFSIFIPCFMVYFYF